MQVLGCFTLQFQDEANSFAQLQIAKNRCTRFHRRLNHEVKKLVNRIILFWLSRVDINHHFGRFNDLVLPHLTDRQWRDLKLNNTPHLYKLLTTCSDSLFNSIKYNIPKEKLEAALKCSEASADRHPVRGHERLRAFNDHLVS